MFINLRRVTKNGIITFWRNGWVSFATVLVMVTTLFVVGTLILGNVVLTSALASIQEKVDITVYFKLNAPEPQILAMKDSLAQMSEIQSVEYVSREQALEMFKKNHADNSLIQDSITQLGENPLPASLNIQAKDPSHYEQINSYLEGSAFSSIMEKVNYKQNELVIDRLSNMLHVSRKVGIGISIALAIISFLVAYHTIRMAIYMSREEIKIMKLVGASNWYTRGPFLVEGFLHGFFASLVALLIFYPMTLWMGPRIHDFFGGPNLFQYYTANLVQFYLVLFLLGIVIGVFSSSIAIRRYLRA